jgi:hypothetical protein
MKLWDVPWVIVQAGGKGTRLGPLAADRPKCLLEVGGRPLLYHLFAALPRASFLVIGDHLADVLAAHLRASPPPVPARLVRARAPGTLGGLRDTLAELPAGDAPFALVWSDLLVRGGPDVELGDRPLLGLSRRFPCRWSHDPERGMVEAPEAERGVAGLFGFPGRAWLAGAPESGDFVRWLAGQPFTFDAALLDEVDDLGTLDAFHAYQRAHRG